jgi:hypothetical protein
VGVRVRPRRDLLVFVERAAHRAPHHLDDLRHDLVLVGKRDLEVVRVPDRLRVGHLRPLVDEGEPPEAAAAWATGEGTEIVPAGCAGSLR